MDSIRSSRSPRSLRWRTPTVIESRDRSSSTWPRMSDMDPSLRARRGLADLEDQQVVVEQLADRMADQQAEQHSVAVRRTCLVRVRVAEDDAQDRRPGVLVDVDQCARG